jgi:hypothetical protein
VLVVESSNPYDRNAVRVDINGLQVGYLPRDDAKAFRERLAREHLTATSYPCEAMIVGGWEGGHFGVRLALALYG